MKPFRKTTPALAVSTALLLGCAPQPVTQEEGAKAIEGYIEDVDKLHVVDCLLPGQLRKLGGQATYLTARRPVRTTAADCEVRGGEYVAYDRANYASALKVWLPKAEEGDAVAQLYVGQIYEKGLGQPADYAAAARWYRKAAEQGNAQAAINLGALYEKGRGVARDMDSATGWYRKASGLDGTELPFAPVRIAAAEGQEPEALPGTASRRDREELEKLREAAARNRQDRKELERLRRLAAEGSADREELERLRRAAEQSRAEAEALRAQLRTAQERLLDQQSALRQSQDELEQLRSRIAEQKSAAPGDDAKVRQLEAELREKEAQLKSQQAKASRMAAAFDQERRRLRRELQQAQRDEPPAPKKKAAAQPAGPAGAESVKPKADPLRAELEATESRLQATLDAYQKSSAELTALLTRRDQGNSEAWRADLDRRKSTLQQQARDIGELKQKAEQLSQRLKDRDQPRESLAQGGPGIEILQPPVTLTRGVRTIPVGADVREIVGKVQSPLDLRSLVVNDIPLAPDASGLFRFPVDPGKPSQAIRITATDKKNQQSRLDLNLIAESSANPEPAPAPVAQATMVKGIRFGKFYALIIGNNTYTDYPSLQTAVNDAKSLDVLLRERYGFHTRLLLNANRYQIMTALNEIHKTLTADDNLLVYYAGHGEIDQPARMAYWLPTDAEPKNPANWISSQSITELLSIMPARHVLVVADSCYSGALAGSAVARLPEAMDPGKRAKWLTIMNTRKARVVLTSGGVQPVLDQGTTGHSVFANAFLGVLRSNQGVLEDYEVFRAVTGQVKASAARAGFAQTPQYAPLQHAGHEGSPFFFVPEST